MLFNGPTDDQNIAQLIELLKQLQRYFFNQADLQRELYFPCNSLTGDSIILAAEIKKMIKTYRKHTTSNPGEFVNDR